MDQPKLVKGTFQGLAPAEVQCFRECVGGMEGLGVEIGCADGYSTTWLLHLTKLDLHSIDPLEPDPIEPALQGRLELLQANTEPYKDRLTFHQTYSARVARDWTEPIDFLFIDGDHRYEGCLSDLNTWGPILKSGGILAMHDSRMSRPNGAKFWEGPSRVADEYIYPADSQYEVIGEAFSLTIARKK